MKRQRAFRFGVIDKSSLSRKEWVQKARRSSNSVTAAFLIRDHFFYPGRLGLNWLQYQHSWPQRMPQPRLRVGSLVFANDYRHPMRACQGSSDIRCTFRRRFELGIGAGWLRSEYEQTEIPFDPPGIRVERMQEALLILKGAFAEQPLTFAGKHYTITHLESFAQTLSKNHIHLYLLAQVTSACSPLQPAKPISLASCETSEPCRKTQQSALRGFLAQKVDLDSSGHRHRAKHGSHYRDNPRSAPKGRRDYTPTRMERVTAGQILAMPSFSIDQITEKIQILREKYTFSYFVISDTCLETLPNCRSANWKISSYI